MSNSKYAKYAQQRKDQSSTYTKYFKFKKDSTKFRTLPGADGQEFPFYETKTHQVGNQFFYCLLFHRGTDQEIPDLDGTKTCPACDYANLLFSQGAEVAGKKVYAKKKYYLNILLRGDEPLEDRVKAIEAGAQIFDPIFKALNNEQISEDIIVFKNGFDITANRAMIKGEDGKEMPKYTLDIDRNKSDLGEDEEAIRGLMTNFYDEITYKTVDEVQDMVNRFIAERKAFAASNDLPEEGAESEKTEDLTKSLDSALKQYEK